MKHKKKIFTLLLASTILTASLTACQKVPDSGDKIDNTTNTTITTIETAFLLVRLSACLFAQEGLSGLSGH